MELKSDRVKYVHFRVFSQSGDSNELPFLNTSAAFKKHFAGLGKECSVIRQTPNGHTVVMRVTVSTV